MPIERRAEDGAAPTTPPSFAVPDGPIDPAWFDAAACCNCGASVSTPFCGQCGQKAAKRLIWRDIGRESWERIRLFELQSATTLRRLVLSPGRVARDYVLGRRTAYMHPLKLLLVLVAVLVLMLAANRYFGVYLARDRDVDRMAQRVLAYANWSFSLGIVAIFVASWTVFRRRLGYNAIEHGVLAVYCQSIILAAIIVNLLPTLIWRDAGFVLAHKAASQYYVPALKLLLVCAAYTQFFLLDLRREWPRLLLAGLVYVVLNLILLRLYAYAILWLVAR